MTDVSHHRTTERADITQHPDAMEMRERYTRVLGGRDVVFVDGPVFLAGLYCAISPWVVHFADGSPNLLVNNLVLGIAISLLALGFTMVPERMYGLSHAICAIGAWLVISPWLVGEDPGSGVAWNNVILGCVVFLLGLASAFAAMRASRKAKGGVPSNNTA